MKRNDYLKDGPIKADGIVAAGPVADHSGGHDRRRSGA
jgi:hypothetical protein